VANGEHHPGELFPRLGFIVTNLRGTNGPFRGPRKHLALQTRLTVALGGGKEYLLGRRKVDNGNSGSVVPGYSF
jgi:hypothetical protein